MKSILVILLLLPSVLYAQPTAELSVKDFQASTAFKYFAVTEVEKVFSDELIGEDVYKVTFVLNTDGCPPDADAYYCEPNVPYCEYALVETYQAPASELAISSTGVSCDKDLEEVLDPKLIDEL